MGKSASKELNNEVLSDHNEYQKQPGVTQLTPCKKLNQVAQQTLHSHGLKEYKEDGNGKGMCK
ncbi:Golgi-associated plant pathogenesis-related protein 1-like [Tupaia chinensis]|uniref:Golgi-associated plant pathogenesis-related protein 1-like n=1 Tax=Tupaia chinensis TaxID=246437 RepID=UPI000FFB7081|nr:Golgi-associated plant pathogenesis-related protein 1-like [Tupaia chinensis]